MNKSILILFLLIVVAVFPSCDKNDPPLPDNLIAFNTGDLGFDEGANELEVSVTASRVVDAATSITINLQTEDVAYGTEFTTEPAAVNNALTLTIPAGSASATFKIKKTAGLFLNGGEAIHFTITQVGQPSLAGELKELKVSFSAITSAGSNLQLEGGEGGSAAENSVFVDLSANRQTAVGRDEWDLGFYSGADFRVIINNATGASAIKVDKTDLTQVSSADINPDDLKLGQGLGSFSLIDDVNGDITKTVIAAVSATESENKVYVINRKGGDRSVAPVADLYKVKISRKDNGYVLQYARLNETTVKSLEITKDAEYNFRYASFDNGLVAVEPKKDSWDFEWGWSMYFTGTIPYGFSDLVFINHHAGVQAAEVLTSAVSYEAFNESNLSGINFSGSRDVIGSKWRATTGTPGVKTDRFYLIKDAAGNIYKLKFISFIAEDGGVRGRPKLEYVLVKKGA
ncbi:heme-binding HmuY-like protein [Arcticibacter tournemirensis]|uniref:HmuY family protein n=1 Tax=Arcticibacter tournemirensis TaxID=699437 RepID=A0A5M9HK41_9SPHI|nr:HmuY family protein [Arcticibacter tournemirensis]KAA8485357.1 hypothetical protein F1649_04365 [Arcticibacter tournemirensis]TQM50354.1 heme-binding HmuY-like protein [Arcticibacter tournemirensis]